MSQLHWQKSTLSGDQANCIELAASGDRVHIRESDAPTSSSPRLRPGWRPS
jgi:hypothetical protein